MSKGDGQKIAIKFDKAILGDVGATIGDTAEHATGKTYSASHEPAGYEASKAFDKNNTTMWRPGYRLVNTWITIDLGEPKLIGKLVIRSATSNYYTAWRLEGSSDNANWNTVTDGGHTGASQTLIYDFELIEYRYWRVYCTARSGNYPGFSEIELYGREVSMNAQAFTITGMQREPLQAGELILKEYKVSSVERYGEEPDTILLTFDTYNRFNDVEGDITVAYNQSLGTLAGTRPVESFSVDFTPADLEPTPIDEHTVTAGIDLTVDLIDLEFTEIYADHTVTHTATAGVDLTVALIDIDDINP